MRTIEMIVYEGDDLKPEVRRTPAAHYEELWVWKYGNKGRMSLTSTYANEPQDAPILLNIRDGPERVTIYRGLREHVGMSIFAVHNYGQEEDYQVAITYTDKKLLQNPEQCKHEKNAEVEK
jgi:hypothetical protein